MNSKTNTRKSPLAKNSVEGFKKPSATDRIREIMTNLGIEIPELTPEFKQQIKERQERESREYFAREAKAAKERQAKKRLDYSEVPTIYIGKVLSEMETLHNETVSKAIQTCMAYVKNYKAIKERGYGLNLFGEPGLGKSHMACALLQEIQLQYETQGFYTTTYNLFNSIKQGFNRQRNMYPDDPIPPTVWEKAMSAEILVLDEIGVQKKSDFVLETLQSLIMSRYDRLLPTILISNLKLVHETEENIYDYLGERVYDRIKERAKTLYLEGESFRRENDELNALLDDIQPNA